MVPSSASIASRIQSRNIGDGLVVAAAGRVQAPGRLADDLLEARFHVHVDVLEIDAELQLAAVDLAADLVETGLNALVVGARDDALAGEHRGMGLGRRDVLPVEPVVEADRGIDPAHHIGRSRREASAPTSCWHRGSGRT